MFKCTLIKRVRFRILIQIYFKFKRFFFLCFAQNTFVLILTNTYHRDLQAVHVHIPWRIFRNWLPWQFTPQHEQKAMLRNHQHHCTVVTHAYHSISIYLLSSLFDQLLWISDLNCKNGTQSHKKDKALISYYVGGMSLICMVLVLNGNEPMKRRMS